VTGPQRFEFKDPMAHNTMTVDGELFTVCKDSWECYKLSQPVKQQFVTGEYYDFVQGGHLGYMDLPNGVFHNRKIVYIKPDIYKAAIIKIGCFYGLDETDIAFTSDLGYPQGFPRSGVFELFTLSNLFICPSYSESFGLTVVEAASRGNFLVLNEAVPALEELGKRLKTYFMRWDARNFGFDTKEGYKPSEQAYLEENAVKIVDLMRDNSVLYAKTLSRQKLSPNWVWYNQLLPLLER